MQRLLLCCTFYILTLGPTVAYTPFNCAATRMGGLADGDTLKTYYSRLFEQCGCVSDSKIPLCEWLQAQKDSVDSPQIDKRTAAPPAK